MGGGTTNPPTCPMAKPMDGDGCDPMGFGGLTCDFGDDTCKCSGFPGPTWTCTNCVTAPMDGDPCNADEEACVAGTSHCECGGFGNLTWDCYDCPNPPPMDGDPCGGNGGANCLYGNTTCECTGFQNPQWSCETCPAQAPDERRPLRGRGPVLRLPEHERVSLPEPDVELLLVGSPRAPKQARSRASRKGHRDTRCRTPRVQPPAAFCASFLNRSSSFSGESRGSSASLSGAGSFLPMASSSFA